MARTSRVIATILLVLLLVPVTVAQQTRSGGAITVPAGETVNGDLDVFAGSATISGVVNGDVTVVAGSVVIDGDVNGDVTVVAGSVIITGDITGNLTVTAGNTDIRESADIDGDLIGTGGNFMLNGDVGRTVRVGAESVVIGPEAAIGGDVLYDAGTFTNQGSVQGVVEQVEGLRDMSGAFNVARFDPFFAVYWFLARFVIGGVLLLAFPRFAERLVNTAFTEPVRSGGIGLLTLLVVPLLLVLVAVTIIGIPLAVIGAVLYGLGVFAATIYGAYTFGVYLLRLGGSTHRWGALALGTLVWAVLSAIPVIGGLSRVILLVLALGAGISAVRHKPEIV